MESGQEMNQFVKVSYYSIYLYTTTSFINFMPSVDCGDLSSPQNGQVILTNTTFGSTATYLCDEGFNLIGDMQRMCQSTGEWSGNEPTCESQLLYVPALIVIDKQC